MISHGIAVVGTFSVIDIVSLIARRLRWLILGVSATLLLLATVLWSIHSVALPLTSGSLESFADHPHLYRAWLGALAGLIKEWNGMGGGGGEWNGMEWTGMDLDQDEWNGMEWNEWIWITWNFYGTLINGNSLAELNARKPVPGSALIPAGSHWSTIPEPGTSVSYQQMVVFDNFAMAFSILSHDGGPFLWPWDGAGFILICDSGITPTGLRWSCFTVAGGIISSILMASFNNMAILFLGIEILSLSLLHSFAGQSNATASHQTKSEVHILPDGSVRNRDFCSLGIALHMVLRPFLTVQTIVANRGNQSTNFAGIPLCGGAVIG